MNTPARPDWEKQGNTAWVACPECQFWYPADSQLIAQRTCDLVCPKCAHAFGAEAPGAVILPGQGAGN